MRAPPCPDDSSTLVFEPELAGLRPRLAAAYLDGNDITIQAVSDPERLSLPWAKREAIRSGEIRSCGVWGTDRLAVALMNAAYEGATALGHSRVVLVLRRAATEWRLLAAARDPISTGQFATGVPGFAAAFSARRPNLQPPAPATLLSPATGDFPRVPDGKRSGDFIWQTSLSDAVIAEIVEFAYEGDVRLVFAPRIRPGLPASVSAGMLWSTRRPWYWRIWSIGRAGDVAVSEARSFVH